MPRKKSWYEIQNSSSDAATIYVYDEISAWGVSAKQFCADLSQVTASNIALRINSPGGDVFDGNAIYEALKNHSANISVQVDGLCASIASVIAMAGDKICMAKNAIMMVHNAWCGAVGNADSLRKKAELLDKIDGNIVNTYAERTGAGKRAIKQLMNDETWMTADEAMKMGFCDCIGSQTDAKASFNLSMYNRVPQSAIQAFGMAKEPTDNESVNEIKTFLECTANLAQTIKL